MYVFGFLFQKNQLVFLEESMISSKLTKSSKQIGLISFTFSMNFMKI